MASPLTRESRPLPAGLRGLAALIAVPLVLVLADVVANRTALRFLLLPPFGALAYLVFVNPGSIELNLRRIVICPVAVTVMAWLVASGLGYSPLTVALTSGGAILIMYALDARIVVPPMALALLTLLLHSSVKWRVDYPVSVFVFTVVIYALYRLWTLLEQVSQQSKA